jgi:hypothetical protein
MSCERLPFFLELACEWWAIADALRERGAPPEDPALRVWREAAWCHLLLKAGRYDAIMTRLWIVLREFDAEVLPGSGPRPTNEAEAVSVATDLFDNLLLAVFARHPLVLGRPTTA